MLSVVVTKGMSGQVGVVDSLAKKHASERQAWLFERTTLAMVYQRFESSRDNCIASGVTPLVSIMWVSDVRMLYCMLKWSHVLQAVGKRPSDIERQGILCAHMRESKVLSVSRAVRNCCRGRPGALDILV